MNITGNTVFIPGATSGIGLALAHRLRHRGNTVIIGGRRAELLADLRAEHGFGTVPIDVSDSASIAHAAATVIAGYPDLNVLVTMAGIMQHEDWHEPETFLATAEHTVATNLLGPVRLIAAFSTQLQSQPAATVITVSSGLAWVPLARTPTYSATKAAIHALSEAIRLQFSDTSVQVIELVPPAVRTDLMNNVNNPRAIPLDDFADETLRLLETQPDAHEVLVDAVKFQRFAERRGEYADALKVVNGGHRR
jgi:uncharacterized oxidoreductase